MIPLEPDPSVESSVSPENGHLSLDLHARTACCNHESIPLTDAEFELLAYLAARPGQVVGREELFTALLKTEYDGLCRTIDLRVARLRKKLGDNGRHPRLLKSIRAEGYLLVPPDREIPDTD